ncbi:DUF4275 family protein [Cytobacillus depressus]|uniref:DUF4275 family protein n=1 Tax=Cytobacillus depressus TaxID=1602942 RepID=A0A6L3UWG9_9BACI|nr:DUF4275 family protein [Cytobacillus depressus]KAB2328483.1 DUF4275 family protein [Cytobacillus depressus]
MNKLIDTLQKKRVKVTNIPKWGTYLRNQWEEHFASHLSEEGKNNIHLHDNRFSCGFLWHVFSYETKVCMIEEQANEAFNQVQKKACYVFYQHSNDALIVENLSRINAEDFEDEGDVYVVDKEFAWTYVNTHEKGLCGPYFSWKEGRNTTS